MRNYLLLALALVPLPAFAQKPSAPPPPHSPAPTTGSPSNSIPSASTPQPGDSQQDLVLFLVGRAATVDGTAVPQDIMIERVCNNKIRQQVYAAPNGGFSMQLGSRADTVLDASGDTGSAIGATSKDSSMGIPRRDLTTCDLRVSAAGFLPGVVSLLQFTQFDGGVDRIDVGTIVVQRAGKVEGTTLSAIPYKAPEDARKAYEKGLDAEKNGKLVNARKHYETAVQLYPAYESAWFRLGTVLQKQNDSEAARNAFTQATLINTKYLPPYLALASLAFDEQNWPDVLKFTGHIMELDPLNHITVTGYVVDLDAWNFAEAYFYNAVANSKLNKVEEAEKSALKAEHIDLRTQFPQLHLLLAQIYARKNDYSNAIFQLQTYLELVPYAKDADQLRTQLAQLEQLNNLASAKKPEQE